MSSRTSGRHKDPMEDSSSHRRSCTPDHDEQRVSQVPQQHCTPQKDHMLNARSLMSRYKTMINDVVATVSQPLNIVMVDDFIALTEDGLKALRTVKMEAKSTLRRLQSNPLPLSRKDEEPLPTAPPAAVSPQPASPLPAPPSLVAPPTLGEQPPAAGDAAKPKSYISALRGRAVVSPAKARAPSASLKSAELEKRALDLTTEKIIEARDSSALRSDERHRQAEERRKELQEEKLAKLEEAAESRLQAKQRREAASEKLRVDTKEKAEGATKRADESKGMIKEKAQKSTSRVDEVLFVHDMQTKNKAMKLELKLSEADLKEEIRKEEQKKAEARAAKERVEAHTAVAERHRDISQQRAERQAQRDQHRQENLRRLEESKRAEIEQKHIKAEEREKKVQAQLESAQAEAEARKMKTEERITQSAQLREEQREKKKQQLEKKDQKLKEVKERREKDDVPARPTFQEVLPAPTPAEDEQTLQKLNKSLVTSQRQGKTFVEQYQKECTLAPKDVNRSKLRAVFTRLNSATLTQSRQPLHDLSTVELVDIDHEFVRYNNGFEGIVKVLVEARKASDFATLRVASDSIHRLLLDITDGQSNTRFFVRAGHLLPLIMLIYDEIKLLRRHNKSATLTSLLSIVGICIACVVTESQSVPKLAPARDQMLNDLDAVGLDKFCFAVASTCVDEEDMPCLQYSLLILHNQLHVFSRRKTDAPNATAWVQGAVTSLFTLLQNILTPAGQPLKAQDVLSSTTTCVVYTALRLLSSICRWKLDIFQELLRGTASTDEGYSGTRNELYHIMSNFFHYVASHDDTLERIPSVDAAAEGAARSFAEAVQFGLTLPCMPRIPLPSSCSALATEAIASGGTRPVPNVEASGYLRASLHELILLIGYAALCDGSTQETFSWGKDKPLLSLLLSSLPVQYFSQLRHVLFPTLLSVVLHEDRNRVIMAREMDLQSLVAFLREEYSCLPNKVKLQAQQFHETYKAETAPKIVVPIPKKSWADMDDDEEENKLPSPGHPRAATAAAQAAPAPTAKTAEKEKLAKSLRTATPGLAHFRIDRRFPATLWFDALAFLEKPLPPPAPSL